MDRPSQHGALLGEALAKLCEAGRRLGSPLPNMCATCAFRQGSLPNMSAGTGKVALDCVLGTDPDDFACHEGIKEGERPIRDCVGYAAARRVPIQDARSILGELAAKLNAIPSDDPVRAEFDAWLARADPDGSLDVYQLARHYAKALAA